MIFPPPFCFIDRRHPSMTFRLPVLHWGLDAGSFRLRTLPIIFSQIFLPVPPISCLDAARRSGGAAKAALKFSENRPAAVSRRRASDAAIVAGRNRDRAHRRSEEHTSELQALMRISYA